MTHYPPVSTAARRSDLRYTRRHAIIKSVVICICAITLFVAPGIHPGSASRAQTNEVQNNHQQFKLFIPHNQHQPALSTRLGFGVGRPHSLEGYPIVSSFRAGWYLTWGVEPNPDRPDGIQFVQTVRLHQDLECAIGTDFNRERCPYSTPHSYILSTDLAAIERAARNNPGSIWLIGNEPDRVDWGIPGVRTGRQDEMLPELYAHAYHELYHFIKAIDPQAKIANGGIIQPTPLRLEYLTKVWDTYRKDFGTEMPVDVWNIHNFILREGRNSDWGAGVPPGSSQPTGAYIGKRDDNGNRTYHIDMDVFDQQIRAMRKWMKERGQQNKPLIVSEYGVLYSNNLIFPNGGHAVTDAKPTIDFMVDSFDYFLNTRDCDIGFTADNCRLVQAWNWFVLNADVPNHRHGGLINRSNGEITSVGEAFREYSRRNLRALTRPFPIP
jgi:hypothetical protein